jgi:hypothetical protein
MLCTSAFGIALAYLISGTLEQRLFAEGSQSVQESESDEEACYVALNDLKKSNQHKEDIAFYFGYLSGRLKVTLPSRWKQAVQGILPTEQPMENFPSNFVFEGEKELSDSDIEERGVSSFVSRREDRCVLVTLDKSKTDVAYTTSYANYTRPFEVKCIDRDAKSILWTQEVLSYWKNVDVQVADWNFVDLVSTQESVFVFGFTGGFCYIERIDAETGQTTLKFYSAPMDFPRWETHRVLPPWVKDRNANKVPGPEKQNAAP